MIGPGGSAILGAVNTTTWIIVAVVLVVLLTLLALVVGLQLRKRRRISLTEAREHKELTREERSGNYQAAAGFSFTEAGGGTGTATRPKEPMPRETPRADTPREHTTQPQAVPVPTAGATRTPETTETSAPTPAPTPVPEGTPDTIPGPSPDTTVVEPADVEPVVVPPEVPDAEVSAPSVDEITGVPETIAPIERIDPAAGRLDRLRGRLARSQSSVGQGLLGLLGAGDLDEDAWEEIEDTLIMADLGSATTELVVDRLRAEIATRQVRTEAEVRDLLRQALIDNLHPEYDRAIRALPNAGMPAVLLVVGVNGTGKTTTTGKLARVLVAQGRNVLLGAADTFRAAAADQLQTWAERVGAEVVRGREGADPASVAFDAVTRGVETGVDAVLVDTAGRLHTKTGLMDELSKVKRVVEKKTAVDEVLLVIDATTGQNGLMQARVFKEVVDITGVVLTKLDGTAKGGIVFQVQHELGVPVKLVGLGEGADDLAPFTPDAFVDALLGT